MLKKVGVLLSVFLLCAPAWAAREGCPDGYALKKVGNITGTTNTTISTQGHDVRLIVGTCTSSACVAALYDANGTGGTSAAKAVIEPGGAASTSFTVPPQGFFENPLVFKDGIHLIGSNLTAIAAYSCQPR